jgi:hypothetical protein
VGDAGNVQAGLAAPGPRSRQPRRQARSHLHLQVFGLASWMLFHGPLGPALSFLVSLIPGNALPCTAWVASAPCIPGSPLCPTLGLPRACTRHGGSGFGFIGGLVSRWRTDAAEAVLLAGKFPRLIEVGSTWLEGG